MNTLSSILLLALGMAQEKPEYRLKGEAIEACECEAVCPCVWTKDATFTECRGSLVFVVTEGSYGKTDLSGTRFCMTAVHSGKNMVKAMGKWEVVLYIDEKAAAAQRRAIEEFVRGKFGPVFSKLEVKSVAIETRIDGDHREATLGKISTIKISALKNPDGKIPAIENAPLSLYPKLYCAKADVHTYDDGVTWDFTGRNAFYGSFEYSSK